MQICDESWHEKSCIQIITRSVSGAFVQCQWSAMHCIAMIAEHFIGHSALATVQTKRQNRVRGPKQSKLNQRKKEFLCSQITALKTRHYLKPTGGEMGRQTVYSALKTRILTHTQAIANIASAASAKAKLERLSRRFGSGQMSNKPQRLLPALSKCCASQWLCFEWLAVLVLLV